MDTRKRIFGMESLLGVLQSAATVFAALLLRQMLVKDLGLELPGFSFLFTAATLASWLFGLWPGMFAVVLATLLGALWVIPPAGHFKVLHLAELITLVFFASMGTLLNVFFERFRRQRIRILTLAQEEAIYETREKLAVALASMAEAVLIMDAEGRFIDYNDAFARFYRFKTREDCPSSFAEFPPILEVSLAGGGPFQLPILASTHLLPSEMLVEREYNLRRTDTGETWTGSFTVAPIRDKAGALAGSVVVARDVTEQRRAADALRASEQRYRTIFQTSQDAILLIGVDDERVIDVNQSFIQFTGFARNEAVGLTTLELGLWEDAHDRRNLIDMLRRGISVKDLQARFRRKNGEIFWGIMSSAPIEIEGKPCFLSVLRDISAAKLAEEEIKSLAFYDPLTGLANRRLLMEQLRRSIALSQRNHAHGAVLFIDLDNFKNLNDTLGHPRGDLLLKEVAQRLSACVRYTDTVSRLGGDEFLIQLEDLSSNAEEAAAQAGAIAEKILIEVDQSYQLEHHTWTITCSIGIAVYGERDDMNELLRQADLAMYGAKAAGRDRIHFFAPELQAALVARTSLEEDLRRGIRNGEFSLYFQPQFHGSNLVGAEALLRWNHPRRGLLAPGSFIAVAEESRLILPLGQWILDTACAQIATWAARTLSAGLVLAVNISALQLRQRDFAETVLDTIRRHGANPRQLKLELTESMLLDDPDDAITKMTALREYGVRFSLDDFGTGYSSLSYLKRLPLDELKIDRFFIHDILSDPGSAAIAEAIVSMSRAMKLPVIAEGVETEQQRETLAAIGYEHYQGYLFSKPLPVRQFEELLEKDTPRIQ